MTAGRPLKNPLLGAAGSRDLDAGVLISATDYLPVTDRFAASPSGWVEALRFQPLTSSL
jgi:hypothetical protein